MGRLRRRDNNHRSTEARIDGMHIGIALQSRNLRTDYYNDDNDDNDDNDYNDDNDDNDGNCFPCFGPINLRAASTQFDIPKLPTRSNLQ